MGLDGAKGVNRLFKCVNRLLMVGVPSDGTGRGEGGEGAEEADG